MPRKIIELTEEQKEKALELLSEGMIRKEVAARIHTRYENLKAFLDKNNIPIKKQGIPYEFYQPIFEKYEQGYTLKQIHDLFYPQFTVDQINYICREKGITRKNGNIAKLNHNYFSEINSPEKAYWLGLLFADGCIRHEKQKGNSWVVQLSLMKEDKYLVEEFAKAVETDKEVKEYCNKTGFQRKDGAPHIECRINLYSSKMAKDLEKYGVVPRKSLKVKELPNIEERYMSHFIRGFFDGNGTITHFMCHEKEKPRIGFYSTHDFCDNLNQYLNKTIKTSLNKVCDQKNEKVSFISFSKKEDVKNLYDFMYKDAEVFLKRKKQKIEKYISEYRDNCEE